MSKQKIILDTDPGVDDAICLALTCAYDDLLELLAVTTIGGNNYTSVTTQNALNLLAFFNKPDIPVYYGEDQYLNALSLPALQNKLKAKDIDASY